MKNYVISLTSALDRRKHIEQEFGKQNIEFEFFDAIMPDQAQVLFKKFFPQIDLSRLSRGEIACSASHIMIWQILLEQNLEYITVFEDDIFLGKNVEVFLNTTDWLPEKWDIIKLETFLEKTFLSSNSIHVSDRQLYTLKGAHFGTGGYMISKSGAKKLLEYIGKQQYLTPIDHIMFAQSLNDRMVDINQFYPAICIQEKILKEQVSLSSELESSRQNWQPNKGKLSFMDKVLREIFRLGLQIKKTLFAKIVPFC